MKKVKEFNSLYRLHVEEDFGFHGVVKNYLLFILDTAIDARSAEYLKALDLFDHSLKDSQTSPYTEKIQAADQKLDELMRSLKQIVKYMLKFPLEVKQEAAKEMFAILEKYGDITTLNYEEQSSGLQNILQDFDLFGEEKQILLGVKEIIDELNNQKTNFDYNRAQRTHEHGSKEKGYVAQCRKDTDEAYYSLIELINALVVVNGDEAYKDFIFYINGFIDEQTARLAARKTRNKTKKDVSKSPNATVDTVE